jgi:hypothetical protein
MRALAAALAATLALGVSRPGLAEPMDPALERLVLDSACRDEVGHFVDSDPAGLEAGPGQRAWCAEDNAAFKRLVSQLGFALAPTAMHSARTTGFGGIDVTMEAAYTKISGGARYWKLGTQGERDPNTDKPATSNADPSGVLSLYSVRLRKGFGFGFEIAGSVGFLTKTSILSGGADMRLSVLEGFRTGLPGYVPDLAAGGGVRTITGTPQLQLTVASFDIQISKPIPLQGFSVLTPWIGVQQLWIFGNSGNIDLTPATDAQAYCGYAGPNVPGNPDPNKNYFDGQPVCTNPSPGAARDFNNTVVFDDVTLERRRLLLGVGYRWEMIKGGVEFITDLSSPASAQSDTEDEADLEGEARQWTLVLELGAAF